MTTASYSSLATFHFQSKIIKLTDRRMGFICLHGTRLCVSSVLSRQLSSFPQLGCVFWVVFFFPLRDAWKASMFQHKKKKKKSRRSGGACQGWKIWLTEEECKFEKTRMEFSLLTGAQKTDVSSWFQRKMIVLSFSAWWALIISYTTLFREEIYFNLLNSQMSD